MFLFIEANKNCEAEERVFSVTGQEKTVSELHIETPSGIHQWCEVSGVDESGSFSPAKAVLVNDSGAGTAYLIFGGGWGVRFRESGDKRPWSLDEKNQWGVPFKVLDESGADIRFK